MTAMNSCDEQSHFQAKPVLAYVICNRWPVAQFICVSDSNLSTLHFRSGFFFSTNLQFCLSVSRPCQTTWWERTRPNWSARHLCSVSNYSHPRTTRALTGCLKSAATRLKPQLRYVRCFGMAVSIVGIRHPNSASQLMAACQSNDIAGFDQGGVATVR